MYIYIYIAATVYWYKRTCLLVQTHLLTGTKALAYGTKALAYWYKVLADWYKSTAKVPKPRGCSSARYIYASVHRARCRAIYMPAYIEQEVGYTYASVHRARGRAIYMQRI
jgi:hypothetical protein